TATSTARRSGWMAQCACSPSKFRMNSSRAGHGWPMTRDPVPSPSFHHPARDATPMKASDVKKGNVVEHEGTVYQVRDIERSSPTARGGNVTFRFTLYSIPGGRKYDLSLRADD